MRKLVLLLCALGLWASDAAAYPASVVRIIVAFPPGGAVDLVARSLAQELSARWPYQVVVDNKPGAGTIVGTEAAAKAAPDGQTLLLAVTSLAVNASLYDKLPYNALKDFVPISLVASAPNVLMVNASLPVKNVDELVALIKANPGKYNFGSPGVGSLMHLAGELFKSQAGIDVMHVPYKGTAPMLSDLISGQVEFTFDNGALLEQVYAGKLKALAVTGKKRLSVLPDVPTMIEVGLPGFEATSWYGLFAPAGTPDAVVQQINRDVNRALEQPELRERLAKFNLTPAGTTPAELGQHLSEETARWEKVIRGANIRVE